MRSYTSRCLTRQLNYEIYKEYLESQDWRDLSHRLKEERGSCAVCGSKEELQCHHQYYRWIDTPHEEKHIQVLCREHHKLAHNIGV